MGFLISIIVGPLVGLFATVFYNQETCSTLTQQLEGCTVINPGAGAGAGAFVGLVLGLTFASQAHSRKLEQRRP